MASDEHNPFPEHADEHRLWEWWRREYFRQPVHSQLFDLESRLRATLAQLLQVSAEVDPERTRRALRTSLLELEATIDALTQAAEVAYARAIANPSDGFPNQDGDS